MGRAHAPLHTFPGIRVMIHALPFWGPAGLQSDGWKESLHAGLRTVLPSGQPAVLRIHVSERGLLLSTLVPRLHLLDGAAR